MLLRVHGSTTQVHIEELPRDSGGIQEIPNLIPILGLYPLEHILEAYRVSTADKPNRSNQFYDIVFSNAVFSGHSRNIACRSIFFKDLVQRRNRFRIDRRYGNVRE